MSTQALDNPQQSGEISHDEVTVAVSESSLLVPLAKSKKLAAIRKRSQALQTIANNPVPTGEIPSTGLSKELKKLLNDAQDQINARISNIMASYPPGKKNSLFALRYGSPENIKQMNISANFTHLGLVKPKKFTLIESLDYFGNDTRPKKTGS